MLRTLLLTSFFLTFISGFVYADEQDYAGQEKIIPAATSGVAPYATTFTIPKDPAFTYELSFGDATKRGEVKCAGVPRCATVRITHTYTNPGTYVVELYRVNTDGTDGVITGKSLRALAARAYVTVKDAHPAAAPDTCSVWFNGCVECTRAKKGEAFVCPKKQCVGALAAPVCKKEFYINKPPVSVRITGPDATADGRARTWAVSARDPEGDTLKYALRWGDETKDELAQKLSLTQNTTYTHTYDMPGAYTITAYARDAAGGVAQATKRITVNDSYAGVVCTREYAPVCGMKEDIYTTYANECMLHKAHATKKSNGPC